MSGVRARLADALIEINNDDEGYECTEFWAECVVDVLLSLPGIAIVELPEPPLKWALGHGDVEDLYARDGLVIISGIDAISPICARELAAALLAAANAAEATQ